MTLSIGHGHVNRVNAMMRRFSTIQAPTTGSIIPSAGGRSVVDRNLLVVPLSFYHRLFPFYFIQPFHVQTSIYLSLRVANLRLSPPYSLLIPQLPAPPLITTSGATRAHSVRSSLRPHWLDRAQLWSPHRLPFFPKSKGRPVSGGRLAAGGRSRFAVRAGRGLDDRRGGLGRHRKLPGMGH